MERIIDAHRPVLRLSVSGIGPEAAPALAVISAEALMEVLWWAPRFSRALSTPQERRIGSATTPRPPTPPFPPWTPLLLYYHHVHHLTGWWWTSPEVAA